MKHCKDCNKVIAPEVERYMDKMAMTNVVAPGTYYCTSCQVVHGINLFEKRDHGYAPRRNVAISSIEDIGTVDVLYSSENPHTHRLIVAHLGIEVVTDTKANSVVELIKELRDRNLTGRIHLVNASVPSYVDVTSDVDTRLVKVTEY